MAENIYFSDTEDLIVSIKVKLVYKWKIQSLSSTNTPLFLKCMMEKIFKR